MPYRFAATLALVFTFLVQTGNAHAGEFAQREIHGFSRDGGLFAFEEYGVQDGSGFPYANIYVIDTQTDKWTAGSPFRVRLEDETKDVEAARQEVRMLACPVMKSFDRRGEIVATYRPSQLGVNKKRISTSPRRFYPALQQTVEFKIETLPFPPSETCANMMPEASYYGFRLLQIATEAGQTTHMLHEDTKIPSSRSCPLDYEFADVVTYFPENEPAAMAILIFMKRVGFEGPDGRYLAITGPLK